MSIIIRSIPGTPEGKAAQPKPSLAKRLMRALGRSLQELGQFLEEDAQLEEAADTVEAAGYRVFYHSPLRHGLPDDSTLQQAIRLLSDRGMLITHKDGTPLPCASFPMTITREDMIAARRRQIRSVQ